ncbi:MAG: hypothetical protein U0744_11775 [Gemmataceae bacterium]
MKNPHPGVCALAAVRCLVAHELNVLALVKGSERYVFVFDDESRAKLIDSFRDLAANPHLSLTWFDALVLTKKAREQEETETDETVNGPRPRM